MSFLSPEQPPGTMEHACPWHSGKKYCFLLTLRHLALPHTEDVRESFTKKRHAVTVQGSQGMSTLPEEKSCFSCGTR